MSEPQQSISPDVVTNLARRDIVLGCHSAVWQRLALNAALAKRVYHAMGHREVGQFTFAANDRVWVFSYSRREDENIALLRRLRDAGVAEIIYLSSSSTCVAEKTSCYEYPRVKRQAELMVQAMPVGKVLTVGLIYVTPDELPAGENVATSIDELADFMRVPNWPDGDGEDKGNRKNLLRVVSRPFPSRVEHFFYRCYGVAIAQAGRYPCLLRPADLILRSLNMRWYGYVYLSNRAWISTIS